MSRGHALRQAAKLAQVQQVRLVATEATMTGAREASERAALARRGADEAAAAAHADWAEHLASRGFAPERARDFATRGVARDAAAREAEGADRTADDLHLRAQADWRLSAARVELANAALKAARRDAARRAEERSLAELSDRVALTWRRS